MKTSRWPLYVIAMVLSFPDQSVGQDAPAPVSFTGSVAVATDYTFRGISQTLEEIAIQGGITATNRTGLYLGTWGSSLNFGEASNENRAHTEIDVFGGFKRSLSGVDLDLGFIYYAYPGTSNAYEYDFVEFALGLGRVLGPASLGAKVSYSPDYFLASGSGVYVTGSLGYAIPNTPLSLTGAVGHQAIETNSAFGTPDYTDFSVGAWLSRLGVSVGAAFVGTDLGDGDCFGGSELCKKRVVFSLSRGM
jgi:uncharacterized protein (TIGR02001 family)